MSKEGLLTTTLDRLDQLEQGRNPQEVWRALFPNSDSVVKYITDDMPGLMLHAKDHTYMVIETLFESDSCFLVKAELPKHIINALDLRHDELSKQWLICGFNTKWDHIKALLSCIVTRIDGKAIVWRSIQTEDIQNDSVRKKNPPELCYKITRFYSDSMGIIDRSILEMFERSKSTEDDLDLADEETLDLFIKMLDAELIIEEHKVKALRSQYESLKTQLKGESHEESPE